MTCASSRGLMGGLLDEELDAGLRTEIQRHLAECRECSEVYSRLQVQKGRVRRYAPRYDAPPMLLDSVRASLRREAALDTKPALGGIRGWRWAAIAASVLLCFSLAWNLFLIKSGTGDEKLLEANLFSSHVRSLIGTHLLDVPSSDQHTVKPWFNGKLDYSPDVRDFTDQGFPLIGGRIEYLSKRTVAALVFRRRQHVVNLFTWPAAAEHNGPSAQSLNGYNLVHWSKDGMSYWAVSDITMDELHQFEDLYKR